MYVAKKMLIKALALVHHWVFISFSFSLVLFHQHFNTDPEHMETNVPKPKLMCMQDMEINVQRYNTTTTKNDHPIKRITKTVAVARTRIYINCL